MNGMDGVTMAEKNPQGKSDGSDYLYYRIF